MGADVGGSGVPEPMTTTPDEHDGHDQDSEPPTWDGREAPFVDPDDTTPGSDPDPYPGGDEDG